MASIYSRANAIKDISDHSTEWDIVIVGGGASGLGCVLDATSRGFKTLLLEQCDFASGTSSKSTKLVHGGVRYLSQGKFKLVQSALKERSLLLKNAPHLVHPLSFLIPSYHLFTQYYYLAGLKLYDLLSGFDKITPTKLIPVNQALKKIPNLKRLNLKGAIEYFDAQFDDARLAVNLAQTAVENGATVLNHAKVTDLLKNQNGFINGVKLIDKESKLSYSIKAKTVINATGVYVDNLMSMDSSQHKNIIKKSQGAHLTIPKHFLSQKHALMIPSTKDNRVLFCIPWHDVVILGTTDTSVENDHIEPTPLASEIDFILDTVADYLEQKPEKKDILSIFTGLRPLVSFQTETNVNTKNISREHYIYSSASNLITLTGGKWTSYRKMAKDTINQAIETGKLDNHKCNTENLLIHGHNTTLDFKEHHGYGSDWEEILKLSEEYPELKEKIIEPHYFIKAQIVWSVRNEFVRTIQDFLSRRIRLVLTDAKSALKAAPIVAEIIAKELSHDEKWIKSQLEEFTLFINNYIINDK